MLKFKFLVDFGSKIIIYFLTALTGILVSRIAGPEVIGTLGYGLSFVTMFFFMFGLFGTSHIKLISEGKNFNDCLKVYSLIIFTTFLLFLITVTGFFLIQKFLFGKEFTETEEIVIVILMIVVGVQGLFKIPEITFTAKIQQVKINLPKLIKAVVYNIGRLIVVLLGFGAVALASVNLLTTLLLIPIYFIFLGKDFLKGSWDSKIFKRYVQIGVPILVITISLSLMENYSKVLFKDYSSTLELGYFYGGVSLASMLIMVGGSAGTLFFPIFSKAYAEGKYELIQKQVAKYQHFLTVLLMPLILGLSVFSDTIIRFLLGEEYIRSVPVFSILVFVSFFKIWSIPYYNLLNGMNKFKLNAYTHIFFFVMFFLFLVAMVHKDILNLGAEGLALSYLFLYIMKVFVWYYLTNKHITLRLSNEIWKLTLLFIVLFFAGFFAYNYFISELNYFLKFVCLAVYLTMVYFVLFILKFLSHEDIDFLLKLLNLKDLIKHSKQELKE